VKRKKRRHHFHIRRKKGGNLNSAGTGKNRKGPRGRIVRSFYSMEEEKNPCSLWGGKKGNREKSRRSEKGKRGGKKRR